MPVKYASFAQGREVNYWSLDPVLRAEVVRTYPSDDQSWAIQRLEDFGELVGTTVARNADIVDATGPVLHTYDREGELVNDIDYHPAQCENEQAAYEAGIVADSFRAPPDREHRLPPLHTLTMDYLLSYVDIGLA